MNTLLLLLLAAAPDPAVSVLEPFRAAWNAHQVEKTRGQVSDNATFTAGLPIE